MSQGCDDRLRLRPTRLAAAYSQQTQAGRAGQTIPQYVTDPLRIALVRDMWLTGFDAPSLHTMYVDKPMRGHGLMQAIARVNRVFKDKPGGLVVDYLGLAHELKRALATYTESGGTGKTALDHSEAVAVMLEKYEVCVGLFHRLRLVQVDHRHAGGDGWGCCRLPRSTSWPRTTARSAAVRAVRALSQGLRTRRAP